uniref:Death-associated protein kinase 1-like n=1 Tax=Castor canadensis TaxID=51338 RepID=A0A8B7TNX5_CASCN|nr:death-associated protein kinase 1-like [Castor canadensis]
MSVARSDDTLDEEDSFVMKAIVHAISDDNVPGLQHLLGSLSNYDVNQPNKVCFSPARVDGGPSDQKTPLLVCPLPVRTSMWRQKSLPFNDAGLRTWPCSRGPSFTLQLLP